MTLAATATTRGRGGQHEETGRDVGRPPKNGIDGLIDLLNMRGEQVQLDILEIWGGAYEREGYSNRKGTAH